MCRKKKSLQYTPQESEAAFAMKSQGFSSSKIGRLIGKTRKSIQQHLRRKQSFSVTVRFCCEMACELMPRSTKDLAAIASFMRGAPVSPGCIRSTVCQSDGLKYGKDHLVYITK